MFTMMHYAHKEVEDLTGFFFALEHSEETLLMAQVYANLKFFVRKLISRL